MMLQEHAMFNKSSVRGLLGQRRRAKAVSEWGNERGRETDRETGRSCKRVKEEQEGVRRRTVTDEHL